MIFIINSPVITSFGSYTYIETSVDDIKKILEKESYISAIGHEEIAVLLSRILNIKVMVNRITISQMPGDKLIVIKPKPRLELDRNYSDKDIEEIGFELGILERNY